MSAGGVGGKAKACQPGAWAELFETRGSWDLGSSVEMAADKATNTAAFFQGPC